MCLFALTLIHTHECVDADLNIHSRNVEDGVLNVTALALERGRNSLSTQHAGAGGEVGLQLPPLWRRFLIQTTWASITTSTGMKERAFKTGTDSNTMYPLHSFKCIHLRIAISSCSSSCVFGCNTHLPLSISTRMSSSKSMLRSVGGATAPRWGGVAGHRSLNSAANADDFFWDVLGNTVCKYRVILNCSYTCETI